MLPISIMKADGISQANCIMINGHAVVSRSSGNFEWNSYRSGSVYDLETSTMRLSRP